MHKELVTPSGERKTNKIARERDKKKEKKSITIVTIVVVVFLVIDKKGVI